MGIRLEDLPDGLRRRILSDAQPCRAEAQRHTAVPLAEKRVDGAALIVLRLTGQIRGGKNSVQTTRTGHRYPNKAWAKWRDAAVAEVRAQLPAGWQTIAGPVNVGFAYIAGDRRRRDFPAIVDAVWHVFEKAEVVTDDTYLWPATSSRGYDPKLAGVTVTIFAP